MTTQEKNFVRTLAQYIAEQQAQHIALLNVLELNGTLDCDDYDDELDDVRPKIVRNIVDRILRELEADSHDD